jgi:hypothetical protein
VSVHTPYDFDHQIRINYSRRPTLNLDLINPLKQSYKTVHIEKAIIDSGADRICVPKSFGQIIGHEIPVTKDETEPLNLGGVADRVRGYRHSAELQLMNPKTNEPIKFLDPIETDVYFTEYVTGDHQTEETNHPMLLGREGFFDQFLVTFHTTSSSRFVTLTPRTDLVA